MNADLDGYWVSTDGTETLDGASIDLAIASGWARLREQTPTTITVEWEYGDPTYYIKVVTYQRYPLDVDLGDDCLWCVDGHVPAGTHRVLGPVFTDCPVCVEPCAGCHGQGLTVALLGYFELLTESLWHLGIEVNHCRECLGITTITRRRS